MAIGISTIPLATMKKQSIFQPGFQSGAELTLKVAAGKSR